MIMIDITMPSVCDSCPMFDDDGDYPTCIVTGHSCGYTFSSREKRMDDCPIRELKEVDKGEETCLIIV